MEDIVEEARKQAAQCQLAGCTKDLVPYPECDKAMDALKEDICLRMKELKRSIRPSVILEFVKIAGTIGVPLLYFYSSFKVLEAKFEFLAKALGVSLKHINGGP